MAHNISPRKLVHAALSAPASNFTGHVLEVTCGGSGCERISHFDVAGLLGYFRLPSLGAALPRLRCRDCGCGPGRVRLVITSGTARDPEFVALRGPGSI